MAFKSKYSINIPNTKLLKGIDYYLYLHCKENSNDFKVLHKDILLDDSIDTHGLNNISINRECGFDKKSHIYTITNFNISDMKLPPSIISKFMSVYTQCYTSESMKSFKMKLYNKYNFKEYNDINYPAVFFGMYRDEDYEVLKNHNSESIVIWCGSDSMIINDARLKILKNKKINHIAMSEFISKDLKKLKIKHKILPITPTITSDITPHIKGDCVYVYTSKKNPKFYGQHIIDEIKKIIKIDIIVANSDTYSRSELIDVYKKCFIGLRLTEHDGLPNTVVELGLMGRRCIYNGNMPNCIKWSNINDICHNIIKEYNNRNVDDIELIHNDMKNYIDIGSDWIDDIYKNK
jgi:hypothetical protein